MSNPIVFSGLDDHTFRRLLGERFWLAAAPAWRAPDGVIAQDGKDLGDSTLYWLYRSPARELLEAPADEPTEAILGGWAARNHAALNLRRTVGQRLLFLDIDALAPSALAMLLNPPADAAQSDLARTIGGRGQELDADALLAAALDGLLGQLSPRADEVKALLDAASWPPRGDRFDIEPESESLLPLMVDVLRKGRCDSALLPRVEASDRRAAQLQKELTQEQLAFGTLRTELEGLRGERDRIQVQLHQVQEELEQYYSASLKLKEQIKRLEGLLNTQQDQMRSRQEAQTRTDEEMRALRMQVQYMQDELLSTASSRFLPAPILPTLWERTKTRARRSVLGRIGSYRRDGAAVSPERAAQVALLGRSRWFDRQWYRQRYPDVADANVDPVEHYLEFGAKEGRDPGPEFSTEHYVKTNADVAESGINPLLHFIQHGIAEGRLPRKP